MYVWQLPFIVRRSFTVEKSQAEKWSTKCTKYAVLLILYCLLDLVSLPSSWHCFGIIIKNEQFGIEDVCSVFFYFHF